MKILNFEYKEIHLLYLKWYISVCLITIVIFVVGKKIYEYGQNKGIFKKDLPQSLIDAENEMRHADKVENNDEHTERVNNTDITAKETMHNTTKKISQLQKVSGKDIFYLYWTGGYDSSYRLCEMLIIEKKIVQPIYVTYSLDNDCTESEEKCKKLWVRRNRKQEKAAMSSIKKELFKQYPWCRKLLLPTLYVNEDIKDELFNNYYDLKFYKDNLWPKKRSKHQYLFLSKYAYYHKIYIDTGILGIHNKTRFKEFLDDNLIKIKERYYSPATNKYMTVDNYGFPEDLTQEVNINDKNLKSKHYMYYMRMSCYGRTKKDLLIRAKKYGFDNIIKHSWSCWFPRKDGSPCTKCPMCRERIVSHPDNKV
jgi:hypothetical protein